MKLLVIDNIKYSFRDLKDNEIYKSDGIYCTVCGEEKVIGYDGLIFDGKCSCQLKQIQEQAELERKLIRINKVSKLKAQSLLHDRYNSVSFNTSEKLPQHKELSEYAVNAAENYKKGVSLYLYGKYGTGKTHSMACISNALMDKLYSVHFTNFNNIVRDIKSTFSRNTKKTEQDIFEILTDVDFLFIDDIGTEYIKDKDGYIQSVIYDVINTRYNKYKPCVFSSNYSILDLCGLSNIEERTGQRIYEMCKGNVIEFNGRNFRI